eukprot:c9979_g1_i1.p1 GENE.c9979_g1_i1~~c9979_g1_i1.p1  ORF type:complete len:203 (-),score=87.17 c9979_g1_i1:27-635(-)
MTDLTGEYFEGYMLKQGGRVKTWKKRWFVLTGEMLCYYKVQNDSGSLISAIPIEEDWIVQEKSLPKHPYSFELSSSKAINKERKLIQLSKEKLDERVFVFSCQTEEERIKWIAEIQKSVNKLGSKSASTGSHCSTLSGQEKKNKSIGFFVQDSDDENDQNDTHETKFEKPTRLLSIPMVILQRPSNAGETDVVLIDEQNVVA